MFQNKMKAARPLALRIRFKSLLAFALLALGARLFAQSLSLLEQSAQKGQTLYWDTLTQSGSLEKNGKQVFFRAGSNVILLDNERFAFTEAARALVVIAMLDTEQNRFHLEDDIGCLLDHWYLPFSSFLLSF